MSRILDFITSPTVKGQLLTIIGGLLVAVANLGRSFGWFDLTPDEINSINGLAAIVLSALALGGAAWSHGQVTPVASPTLAQGTTVTVVTPAGQPNTTTTV